MHKQPTAVQGLIVVAFLAAAIVLVLFGGSSDATNMGWACFALSANTAPGFLSLVRGNGSSGAHPNGTK
jgi:hypothetical protein